MIAKTVKFSPHKYRVQQKSNQEDILEAPLRLTEALDKPNPASPVTPDINDASTALKQLVGMFLKRLSSKRERHHIVESTPTLTKYSRVERSR